MELRLRRDVVDMPFGTGGRCASAALGVAAAALLLAMGSPPVVRAADADPWGPTTRGATSDQRDPWSVAGSGATRKPPEAEEPEQVDGPAPGYGSFHLATAEVFGLNLALWAVNYTARGHQTFHISPGTMWDNLRRLQFDVNQFGMNQLGHPYNGGLYYNAARSNGYGVLSSAAFAFAGSYLWECCFEAEPTSINDLINTTLGGISFGETTHRLAALLHRPEATGAERFGRGLSAVLLDPFGELNLFLTGRPAAAGRSYEGAGSVPLRATLRFGLRGAGAGGNAPDVPGRDGGLVDVELSYGDPFRGGTTGPFEYFDVLLQMDLSGGAPPSRLSIDGVLGSWEVGDRAEARHVFGVNQRFELYRNEAFEYGAPSFTAGLTSAFPLSETLAARTFLALEGVVLGGVGSEYYDRRPNDYGPGLGGIAEARLTWRDFDLLRVGYSGRWIHVVDGAATTHVVQALSARAAIPVYRGVGLGLDYQLLLRRSHFAELEDLSVRQDELRAYLALSAD